MKATGANWGYRIPTNPKSGFVEIPAEPVDRYGIPPMAPAKVATADENFRRLSSEYAEIKSQLSEAFRLREQEIGQAHAAAASSRVEGTKPPTKKPDQVAAEWDAKLDALRSEQAIVADALDQAGNTLVATIRECKAEWLVALDAADEEATAKLAKAVEVVREALEVLGDARPAPRWLREEFASDRPYRGGSVGGHTALRELDEVVKGRQELVGYRDSAPIMEQVGGPSSKEGVRS
jgi:hypothetical protein